jgi:hypothetical protein
MSTNTQAQTEQNQADQNLNIDFSHRLNALASGAVDSRCAIDSIDLITERALAVLQLMSCQFESDGQRLSDRQICSAIESAVKDIEDIQAIISAFSSAEHSKNKA